MNFFSIFYKDSIRQRAKKHNIELLVRYLIVLIFVVGIYTIIFHYLMSGEGREYTWITGVYWVLNVMAMLGFGEPSFASDTGRAFTIIVLLTGILFLIVIMRS